MQVAQGFTVTLVYLLFYSISESASLQKDPCPKRGTHKSWYESGCTKCNCVKNGFECYSCGSSHIFTSPECYLQENFPHASYPLCCKREVICKGDPKFDGNLFKIYQTNGMQVP